MFPYQQDITFQGIIFEFDILRKTGWHVLNEDQCSIFADIWLSLQLPNMAWKMRSKTGDEQFETHRRKCVREGSSIPIIKSKLN